jgi:hypothetical protein
MFLECSLKVLLKAEWLKLMDHLMANAPNFLLFVAAAYLSYFRDLLAAARGEVIRPEVP